MPNEQREGGDGPADRPRKASWRQVAATMFWALFMIGRKGTWERDGAVVTLPQVVAGALVAALVVIMVLVGIVTLALG